MKATVWTSRNIFATDSENGNPKCIFAGDILTVPREGEYITLREGFGSETVRSVTHDFVTGEVEISVHGVDRDNDYGPCLSNT